MKKKRTKKYPIFTYLCYLLAVAALVTSVTFSRYSVATSGSVSTQVALYNCSYEIDGFSSFAFNNSSFYIRDDGKNLIGNTTARTVRFTMRNYKVNEEGKTIEGTATDVNVQGSIRLRVPAELGDKLAIQLTDATAAGASSTVVTPQIVLGELLYAQVDKNNQIVTHREEVGTDSNGNIIYQDVITTTVDGTYANFSNPTTLETENFSNYEERTNNDKALDQEWTVSGGLKTDNNGVTSGSVTVVNDNKAIMTITAETDDAASTYSVGFRRSSGTSLFLDLSKKMTYYTIEISLPSMLLTGGDIDHCTHVAYLSLVNRLANSVYWYNLALNDGQDKEQDKEKYTIEDLIPVKDGNELLGYKVTDENGSVYESQDGQGGNDTTYYITVDNLVYNAAGDIVTNMDQLITAPPSSQNEGYYIDRGAQGISTAADTEDIKVLGYHFEQNTTMRETDNNSETSTTTIVRVNCKYDNNGGYTVTLDHVAPIEEGAANYIHEITWSNDDISKITVASYKATPFTGLTGTCSNKVSTINLSSVTLNPFTNAENQVTVQMAVNRSFNLRMKAAFVQASTLPGS